MAYDEELAQRIAAILKGRRGVSNKKMFGGIAFMINGNMAVGVNESDLMLRVGKDQYEELLEKEGVREMDFTGKALKGFIYVDETGYKNDTELEEWMNYAIEFAESLPKKEKK